MNAQQPYEKHLADELQKLNPSGNANSHWPQMKALLDREMPGGGNGGNRRWWIYGLIAILLLTGTWFGSSLLSNDKKETTAVTAAKETEGTTSSTSVSSGEENKDSNVDGNKDAPKNNDGSASNNSASSELATAINKKDDNGSKPAEVSDVKSTDSKASLTVKNNASTEEENNVKVTNRNINKGTAKINESSIAKNNTVENSPAGKKNAGLKEKNTTVNKKNQRNSVKQVAYVPVISGKNKPELTNSGKTKNNSIKPGNEKVVTDVIEEQIVNASVVRQDISVPEPAGIDYPDSLQFDYALQSQLVTVKTRSRFKTSTDRVKALKNRTVGAGDNKNFVVGLTLPMSFPLGDQNPIAYNHNAGPNTVSDYLPAPHMQYHLNQQSFVQAEIQILSPQYIQPALVYEKRYEQAGGTSNYQYRTNSVYAKKLYYFSLPVGIHYSPFKNFYLGSGLQFSSLLSGVAQYEERGYNSLGPAAGDTLFSQSVQKFKNDSISGQLSNNEFRMMLDANYYWHKFTVGFRYNQALSNFVSVKVNNFSPLYTDKNKSIQFYLRYNIWEDRKKKKPGFVAGR